MSLKKRELGTLEQWAAALRERSAELLVVVEGINDKKALGRLGIERIYHLGRRPLYKCADEIADLCGRAHKKCDCLLLTDLDAEGKRLYRVLKDRLQAQGLKIDSFFREWLFRNTDIRQIEGLKVTGNAHEEERNRRARRFFRKGVKRGQKKSIKRRA